MKILLIDHDDSFTFILAQYLGEVAKKICGHRVLPKIVNHNAISLEDIRDYDPSHIVLSPGPGTVERKEDFAIGNEILRAYENHKDESGRSVPILGVCLGHQGIAAYYGAKIIHAPKAMHGKRSQIEQDEELSGKGIFKNIPSTLTVMRYHSLMIDPNTMPDLLKTTAKTDASASASAGVKLIMAIQHKELPIFGVQFHPESIGTEQGKQLIENFLRF